MPTQKKTARGSSDWTSRIVTDPKEPPSLLLLIGWLDDSSEEEHTRLYLDAVLSNYVEIPNDALVHSIDIPKEHTLLGGSFVWVRREAKLIYKTPGQHRQAGEFLKGKLQRDHLNSAAATPLAVDSTTPQAKSSCAGFFSCVYFTLGYL